MFVSIILFADVTRKLIVLYRNYQGFELKIIRTISFGVISIVMCSVFLVLLILDQQRNAIDLADDFYIIQILWFFVAIFYSAFINIWISHHKGEATLLVRMIPENNVVSLDDET